MRRVARQEPLFAPVGVHDVDPVVLVGQLNLGRRSSDSLGRVRCLPRPGGRRGRGRRTTAASATITASATPPRCRFDLSCVVVFLFIPQGAPSVLGCYPHTEHVISPWGGTARTTRQPRPGSSPELRSGSSSVTPSAGTPHRRMRPRPREPHPSSCPRSTRTWDGSCRAHRRAALPQRGVPEKVSDRWWQ